MYNYIKEGEMKKKSVILSSIVLGLAGLGLLLWLLPINSGISTFYFMRVLFALISEEAGVMMFAIPLVLAFVFNIIVIAFGIVALLNACGVVKSAKLAKAFRVTNIVLVSVSTFFLIFPMVMFASQGELFIGMLIQSIVEIALIVLTAIDLKVGKKLAQEQNAPVETENTVE